MNLRLYLDMDGVLMDFEGAIQASGVERYHAGAHWITRPRAEWPAEMIAADKAYVDVMEKPDFWPSIKPMPDAKLLWDWCRTLSPHILTATPNITAHRDRIASQKRDSIRHHFDPIFPFERIHICLRADKKLLAGPGQVLVDDTPGNCQEWNHHGGTAILHKDTFTTIRILREIFGEP